MPSALAEELEAPHALEQIFLPTPVEYWDQPGGPQGHVLTGGTVYLYRPGSFLPEIVGPSGEPVGLPPGPWVWRVEVEGWVSSFTSAITVGMDPEPRRRTLVVPMVPACHLTLSEDERWSRLDRVDVVALEEQAVFPMVPEFRREQWIPAGHYLAYGVRDGSELTGISQVFECHPLEEQVLGVPEPPAADRQSLLVTLSLPESQPKDSRERLLTRLEDRSTLASRAPLQPTAGLWQGPGAAFFFLDVPVEGPLDVAVRHPELRTVLERLEPVGGSVREVRLGELKERQDLEVGVDYLPARDHATARLEIQDCGPEPLARPAELLVGSCEDLAAVELRPGFQTYTFVDLDPGQYLLNARIDDELVPGLGQQALPYLPADATAPPPLEQYPLQEMEVYGHLLLGDEPVPGAVEVRPWDRDGAIPVRRAETDEDLLYHLYYFARYPQEGFVDTFPEEIRDLPPEELPGLYCCFRFTACSDDGRCRPFNIHSLITGEGRFDVELPAGEAVAIQVLDDRSGAPIPGARVHFLPGEAFHFHDGEVYWKPALGMEPETLVTDARGRTAWLTPAPGEHPVVADAEGYSDGRVRIRVVEGEEASLTLRLVPDAPHVASTRFVFPDGAPLAGGALAAFGPEGQLDSGCRVRLDSGGSADLPQACQDRTFLVLHPLAALVVLDGTRVGRVPEVEVPPAPSYPPRVRIVDENGRPVSGAWIQLRLDGLVVNRNTWAASGAPPPFDEAGPGGEILLHGVDPDELSWVEVAPYWRWQGEWVPIDAGSMRRGEAVEVVAAPTG